MEVLDREHIYFHINTNIGYLVLNQNEEGFERLKDRLIEDKLFMVKDRKIRVIEME
jgi:hypothetical protein